MHRQRRAAPFRRPVFDHGSPIYKPQIAPIAGVWLAIAALLASLYATPQHVVAIDLPYPSQQPYDTRLGLPIDLLRVDGNGGLSWNSQPIDMAELARILEARRQRPERVGLRFAPDPDASYKAALYALAVVKATGNAGAGFCFSNISAHRNFGKPGQASPQTAEPEIPCDPWLDGRMDAPLPPMPVIVESPPA